MDDNIKCTVEALILSSPEPVAVQRLCEVMGSISPREVREAVEELNNLYMGCGLSFRIRELAGGYQMYVLPDFEQAVKRLLSRQRTMRLTRAALEALAIIAYKQPVTKIEIEHIRGVASDGVLHNLLQHDLIMIAGRAESPGRPLVYKTSREFLKFFGLNRLSDLPRLEEIEEMIRQSEDSTTQTVLPLNGGAKAAASDEPEYSDGGDDSVEAAGPSDAESSERTDANGGNGNGDGVAVFEDYESLEADPEPILQTAGIKDESAAPEDEYDSADAEEDTVSEEVAGLFDVSPTELEFPTTGVDNPSDHSQN